MRWCRCCGADVTELARIPGASAPTSFVATPVLNRQVSVITYTVPPVLVSRKSIAILRSLVFKT